MAPWAQIAKPFSLYFAVNCVKTVLGAGFVGYGVALALMPLDDSDDELDIETGSAESSSKNDRTTRLVRKCVTVTTTIGFGLFLSLPSLASQVVWETFIPSITATDIAYDMGIENVRGMMPKWNIKKPTISSLVSSKDQIVGGLMKEAGEVIEKVSEK